MTAFGNDLDPMRFRRVPGLPAEEHEKILADDTVLMLFGFRFLMQVLFGENSITLKKEAAEKHREQVQKMAEQIER